MRKCLKLTLFLILLSIISIAGGWGEYTESHFLSYGTPSFGVYQQEFLNTYVNIDRELTRGYDLLVDFKFVEAARILEGVASDEYRNPVIRSEAYTYLGYAYYNLKDLKKAEDKLNRAVKLYDKNALAYFFMANVYFIDNDFEKTKLYLHKAVEYKPNFVSALRMLAETYKTEDNLDKSAYYYSELIKILPYSGYYHFQYYKVLTMKKDYPKVVEVLNKMKVLEPKFLQNRINLGETYTKMGEFDKAMQEYDDILKDNPDYSKAIAGKASVYMSRGDYENAFREINKAKEIDPNNPFSKSLMTEIRVRRARHNQRIAVATFFILLSILVIIALIYFYNSHKRKQYILSVINKFNKSVDNIYDQNTLLNFLLGFFIDLGGSSKGMFLHFNRQNNQLVARESIGIDKEVLRNFNLFAGEEITNWLTGLNRYVLTIHDIEKNEKFDEVFPSLKDRLIEMKMGYVYPLREKTSFVGFIIVDEIKDWENIMPSGSDLLMTLSTTSAQALSTLTLYETSITDETTGLFNKRYFWQNLTSELKRSERYGQPVSLLMMDIDNFKKLNDTYGHPQGDRVLRDLGQLIISTFREGIDIGARVGGEEFAVILPATEAPKAKLAAERFRVAVHKHVFPGFPEGVIQKITVSMGIATFPLHSSNSKELVEKADEALYVAKRTGKDKVCLVDHSQKGKMTESESPAEVRTIPSLEPDMDVGALEEYNEIIVSSLVDKKTGFFTKDYFNERLMGEVRRSERTLRPCSLFLMQSDLKVNCEMKEMFLGKVSEILHANLRKGIDVTALVDGDVIAVLLPETDQNRAAQIASRIRSLIGKSTNIKSISESTFSIGVSCYPNFGKTEDSLLSSAKQALKMCQQMGGDKALIASEIS
jgi:diguanylate cyclase (GGDEF)-like protein